MRRLCKQAGGKGFVMKVEFVLFGVVLRCECVVEPRYAVFVGREGAEERVGGFWTYRKAVDFCVERVEARAIDHCGERIFGFVRDVTSRRVDFNVNVQLGWELEMRLFVSRSDR